MRPAILCLLLLFLSCKIHSQQLGNSLGGLVKDSRNEAIPGATVRLLRAADSTLVRGVLTDATGKFIVTAIPADTYRLVVTSVGNKDYRSGTIQITDQQSAITLPVFILTPSKTTLSEVNVVAKKPLIEQELDRTIVNVDAMIGSAGSNTLEVLGKIPGVSVDINGEISLNGKAGVQVLIDGRPTHMSGADLAAYLKSLPGGSLDKLELMTNPPAKYEAAGTSIINIRLKRNKLQGVTGNVALGYDWGRLGRSNDVISLNVNHKKVNLFSTLSYSQDSQLTDSQNERRSYDSSASLLSSIRLTNRNQTGSHGGMVRLGMDYAVSPNTTLGFVLNGQRSRRSERLDYVSLRTDKRYGSDSVGTGTTDGDFLWTNKSANLNGQHKFGKSGRQITADLNYVQYETQGEQVLANRVNDADGTFGSGQRFRYKLPSVISIYTARIDYEHPLPGKGKLEAGVRTSHVSNDNNSQYFRNEGANYVPDYGQSNHFLYGEAIHAAYTNIRKEGKRLAVQGGLRLENTQLDGRQLGNPEQTETFFRRSYTNLFPSVFLSYKLDTARRNTLTASMSRRIGRPNYQLLNPFLAYRDQYSFTTGNPYLKPQYITQFELKYQHKQFLGMALQYSRFSNLIFQLTEAVGDTFIVRPDNVANGAILALNTNVSVSPVSWWRLNANVTTAHLALRGKAYSEPLQVRRYSARISLMNQFQFGPRWNAEWAHYYSSNDVSGQTITRSRYRMSAAVQAKIIQGKGSIRLTLDDIFRSWITNSQTVSLKQAEAFQRSVYDTRRIGLAFTYRFGKEAFGRKRNHSDNGADSEKSRVD